MDRAAANAQKVYIRGVWRPVAGHYAKRCTKVCLEQGLPTAGARYLYSEGTGPPRACAENLGAQVWGTTSTKTGRLDHSLHPIRGVQNPSPRFCEIGNSRQPGVRHSPFSESGLPVYGLLGNLEGKKSARVLQGSCPSYRSFAVTYAG